MSNEVLSSKKLRSSVKNKPEAGHHGFVKEQKKPRVQRFTKLKKIQKDKVLSPLPAAESEEQQKDENIHLKEEETEDINDVKSESKVVNCESSPEDDGSTTDGKMEAYCSDDAEGGHKISCETQTEQAGKE